MELKKQKNFFKSEYDLFLSTPQNPKLSLVLINARGCVFPTF